MGVRLGVFVQLTLLGYTNSLLHLIPLIRPAPLACGDSAARAARAARGDGVLHHGYGFHRQAVLRGSLPRSLYRPLALDDGAELLDEPDADLTSAWLDSEEASPLGDMEGALTPLGARELMQEEGAILLDLRTLSQYAEGHPVDARSLPAGEPGASGLLFHFRCVKTSTHPFDPTPLTLPR